MNLSILMKCHECQEIETDGLKNRPKFFAGHGAIQPLLSKDIVVSKLRNEETFTLRNDRELFDVMVTFANERLLSDQVKNILWGTRDRLAAKRILAST